MVQNQPNELTAKQTLEIHQWGLPSGEIKDLGNHFYQFVDPYRLDMLTKTHDPSGYGIEYVSGLLRMETERNITNISHKTEVDS